jgi:signal transduction histidine kinase
VIQPPDLSSQFTVALEEYLGEPGESALALAYELGRQALEKRMGLLDMTALQYGALLKVLSRAGLPERSLQLVRSLQKVFVEGLSAFEMTQWAGETERSAAHRLNEVLEEEIKRFAHLLHGEAGQLLVAVHLALDDFSRGLPSLHRKRLEKVKDLLDRMEGEIRRLSHELRPTALDHLGLLPALEFLAEGIAKRTGISIAVEGPDERFPPAVETALYRIVQEALNNVSLHARANRATVRFFREESGIRCSIRDDGIGFSLPEALARQGERGFGLIAMRERLQPVGGTFEVISAPGMGTEIRVAVPLCCPTPPPPEGRSSPNPPPAVGRE